MLIKPNTKPGKLFKTGSSTFQEFSGALADLISSSQATVVKVHAIEPIAVARPPRREESLRSNDKKMQTGRQKIFSSQLKHQRKILMHNCPGRSHFNSFLFHSFAKRKTL